MTGLGQLLPWRGDLNDLVTRLFGGQDQGPTGVGRGVGPFGPGVDGVGGYMYRDAIGRRGDKSGRSVGALGKPIPQLAPFTKRALYASPWRNAPTIFATPPSRPGSIAEYQPPRSPNGQGTASLFSLRFMQTAWRGDGKER